MNEAIEGWGDKDRRDERQAYQRYRKRFSDLDVEAEESDLALLSYLPKLQQAEAKMLITVEELIAHLLEQLPEEKREIGYKYLVRASHRYGKRLADKVTVESLTAYVDKKRNPLHAYRQTKQLTGEGVQQSHSIGPETCMKGIDEGVVNVDAEVIGEAPEDMLKRLVHMPLFMIVAPQGCGKSTTLQWLATYAALASWRVVIADPHYEYGSYANLPVFGKAKNYDECGELINTILDIVNQRYEERSTKAEDQRNLVPYLFILDEFTSWSRHCKESSEKLITSSLEDFRKAGIHLVFASHGLTKKQTGGADGYHQTLIDSAAVLKLKGEQVPIGDRYEMRPTGKAELVEMGESRGIVDMPNLANWKMPENLPSCDFRLNGQASKSDDSKANSAESITPQFVTSPFGSPKPTRWAVTQKAAEEKMPGLGKLMAWIETKNGESFTLEQARGYKQVRPLIEKAELPGKGYKEKLEYALKMLVQNKLLDTPTPESYKVSHHARSRWEG